MLTERQRLFQYIACILADIRRNHTRTADDFQRIVSNGNVARELAQRWDYYHMCEPDEVIAELSRIEPLIEA